MEKHRGMCDYKKVKRIKAKEYLSKYHTESIKLSILENKLFCIKTELTNAKAVNYSPIMVQSTPHNNIEESICNLIELERKVENEKKKVIETEISVYRVLASYKPKTELYRQILLLRYIQKLSMAEISERMGIKLSYAKNCHINALENFYDICLKNN